MERDDDDRVGDGRVTEEREAQSAGSAERVEAQGHGGDAVEEELAVRTAAMRLDSAASPVPRSPGLTIQIPNLFDAMEGGDEDVEMPTASPHADPSTTAQRVTAAPALPQPPRFAGRTMQDRRDFMQKYETYLAGVNALQTPYSGAFAMPVAACIESQTKRMIAKVPSLVDYAAVDAAMKRLEMKTSWPEPESRMMNLQADLESILDKFNVMDTAFEHEQRRLVKYLTDALAPPSFKAVVKTKLTLHQNKRYKSEVVPFCSWVTQLLREYMTWEHVAPAAAKNQTPQQNNAGRSDRGGRGGRGQQSSRRGQGERGRGSGGGRGGNGGAVAPGSASSERRPARGSCLKCHFTEHQVRECPDCTPEEDTQLLKELRERREAQRGVRKFIVSNAKKRKETDDNGSVVAAVDGVGVAALMLDSGADTSIVARGVLDALGKMGRVLQIKPVTGVTLSPVGKSTVCVTREITFREVVLTTSAGPLMQRNVAFYVEEDNPGLEVIVGRPIMKLLGYSTDKLLVEARRVSTDWELSGDQPRDKVSGATPAATQRMGRLHVDPPLTRDEEEAVERHESRTATPTMQLTSLAEVIYYLEKKVEVATEMGLTLEGRSKLTTILHVRADCFRVEFGNDPPVRCKST